MGNIITPVLPHDLPENWNDTQYVSPGGTEVGLTEKHGYNYLMKQVNNSQKAINELDAELKNIDTILQNNDPRNWGLGGDVVEAPVDSDGWADANLITETGFYRAYSNVPIGGWNYIIHVEYMSGTSFQIGFYGKDSIISIRRKLNSVWQPWELVNPPMKLGFEYRTTERYLGKPVYAMAVDFGNLPNATTKEITVSGVSSPNKVVSVFGYTSDYKTIPTFSYSWGPMTALPDAIALDAHAHPVDGLRIHVETQYNRSDATAIVIVKYTKSTD